MPWFNHIELNFEAAFGDGPYSTGSTWSDITSDIRGYTINRGRSSNRRGFTAGNGTFQVGNSSGTYDPANTASVFAGDLDLNSPFRVKAVHSGTTYTLMHGHIARWPLTYPDKKDAIAPMRVTDNLAKLNRTRLVDAAYTKESSDTRIGNILDDVGFAAGMRNLDTGVTDVAPFSETFAVYLAANVKRPNAFTLTVSGETTSLIDFDATAAEVETAVEALAGITAATVTGTGVNGDPWLITIDNPLQHHTITGTGPGLHSNELIAAWATDNPIWANLSQRQRKETWADPIDEPHLWAPLSDDGILISRSGRTYSGAAGRAIADTVEAEQGRFFISSSGDARFMNRAAFSGSTATHQFAGVGGLPYFNLSRLYDDDALVNKASITGAVGEAQTATDTGSRDSNGEAAYSKTNAFIVSGVEALNVAEFTVGVNKDVKDRIVNFTLKPESSTALWPAVLGIDLQDVVEVNFTPPAGDPVQETVVIERITHTVSPGHWTTVYGCHPLQTFESQDYWTLDTSQLDTETRLA